MTSLHDRGSLIWHLYPLKPSAHVHLYLLFVTSHSPWQVPPCWQGDMSQHLLWHVWLEQLWLGIPWKKYYSWWVLKQQSDDGGENNVKCELALFQTLWRLFNGGHIGVPKQWKGGYVGVSNKSCGSWTLSLCKRFLLFKWMCIYAGHVSKNALLANWRYSSTRDQLKLFSVQNGFIFLKNFLAEQLPVFVWD